MTESTTSRYDGRSDLDAIIYDLDGTLVELLVDWDVVAADAVDALADTGVDATDADLWAMLDIAAEAGVTEDLEAVIAAHECEGARTSVRLPAADVLGELEIPVGVCSLNCEDACRLALETHDLTEYVDVVVGRDSVSTRKPDPAPLLEAIESLSASPERALFVGDSERDEITADRAGVDFEYV